MRQLFFTLLSLLVFTVGASAGVIKGTITDRQTKEPLIGATVQIAGTATGTVADVDGHYTLDIKNGTYTIEVKYVGYKPLRMSDVKVTAELALDFAMEADAQTLGDVTVVARAKKNTDLAQLADQRRSLVVQSGVSAQQISKTQDKDASEVIKRVPGVSIIDDKFVMVRGLSQRYNNVWINGSAVPSSEADARAFSFDIIPSSQLDNMVIVKSPAPEYPSDFTGGFILVNTKDMPSENSFNISVGGAINDQTHFKDFVYNKGSRTDFLGFDNGLRSLQGGMKGVLNTFDGSDTNIDLTRNGLNNDWTLHKRSPIGDLKLNAAYSHLWDKDGRKYGLLASVNYSNTYKTYLDMENSLFGSYDTTNDRPVYLRKSTDNQYNNDVRLGAMVNLAFQPRDSRHHYEWKNIFNQIGKDRYTDRTGFNAQNDQEHNMEYYYTSRTTYNTQFGGKHTLDSGKWDWNAGYAYANRNMPDRRLIEVNDRTNEQMGLYRIGREFTRLDEHIASASMNYLRDFTLADLNPTLKAGAYGEYRTRTYRTREFDYAWKPNNSLPPGFEFADNIANDVLVDANYGPDKLYMQEQVNRLNDYSGNGLQASGYAGVNLPVGKFNVYAGVRYEYNRMELVQNTRKHEESPHSSFYTYKDLFPSVNMSYKLTEKQQVRLAYGKSINRPEFRELSSSVFYDFDLGSDVMGNAALQAAYIQNVDLRYELYPSSGELISVALFYKNFRNPIEWTYTVAGGTNLIYSYMNAKGANNYGVEVDIRKNLDFIGMKDFSLSFNGSLIKSMVEFEPGSKERNRPMQGQSPYLINTGLFYQNQRLALNAAVLYNRIGKRIVGVGRNVGSVGGENSKELPNSYEMPRNTLDLSVSKRFGPVEVKASVRDLLAEKVLFKQMEDTQVGGEAKKVEQVTRVYRPGRTYGLSVSYGF